MNLGLYNKKKIFKSLDFLSIEDKEIFKSFSGNYLKLSKKEINHIKRQLNEITKDFPSKITKNNIIRIDCLFNNKLDLKVNEINTNNPGMSSDFIYQDFFNKSQNYSKYITNYLRKISKKRTLVFLIESNIFDYIDILSLIDICNKNNIIYTIIKDKNKLKYLKKCFLISLQEIQTYDDIKHILINNDINILNQSCFKYDDNKKLVKLSKKNKYILKSNKIKKQYKKKDFPIVIKKRFSKQGLNVNILNNKNDFERFIKNKNKRDYITQEYFRTYNFKNKITKNVSYYSLTFFIIDGNPSGFCFLKDNKKVFDNSAKLIPFKEC